MNLSVTTYQKIPRLLSKEKVFSTIKEMNKSDYIAVVFQKINLDIMLFTIYGKELIVEKPFTDALMLLSPMMDQIMEVNLMLTLLMILKNQLKLILSMKIQ